jgi:hypothetical protein
MSEATNNSKQDVVINPHAQQPPALSMVFHKKLNGTIGNIPVTMDITRIDSALNGSYYYNKIGTALQLNGSIRSDGEFIIFEQRNTDTTGIFSGIFKFDSLLEGKWTNPKTKKSLPFKLTLVTEYIASISFINRKELRLIIVRTKDTSVSRNINQTLLNLLKINSSVDDFENYVGGPDTEEVGDPDAEEGETYESHNCELIHNDNNYICIRINSDYNTVGAAHPYSGSINFDLITGNQIALDDLLISDCQNKLNQIGEKLFIETNGDDGWFFEKGKFKVNNNFAIKPDGLLFSFNPYEIGAYAFGAPKVFFPYSIIKDLIKPDGVLGIINKK